MSARAYRIYSIKERAKTLEREIPKLRYRDFHRLLQEVRRINK